MLICCTPFLLFVLQFILLHVSISFSFYSITCTPRAALKCWVKIKMYPKVSRRKISMLAYSTAREQQLISSMIVCGYLRYLGYLWIYRFTWTGTMWESKTEKKKWSLRVHHEEQEIHHTTPVRVRHGEEILFPWATFEILTKFVAQDKNKNLIIWSLDELIFKLNIFLKFYYQFTSFVTLELFLLFLAKLIGTFPTTAACGSIISDWSSCIFIFYFIHFFRSLYSWYLYTI